MLKTIACSCDMHDGAPQIIGLHGLGAVAESASLFSNLLEATGGL
jgi:hypothetical protein